MDRCLIFLIFGLVIMYAALVTWRWRLAVARAKKFEAKAKTLDKIAKELKPQ